MDHPNVPHVIYPQGSRAFYLGSISLSFRPVAPHCPQEAYRAYRTSASDIQLQDRAFALLRYPQETKSSKTLIIEGYT